MKNWGLNDIGFRREKTTYCYFAASSSTSLPFESETNVRKLMAKSGILITVADDFFDEEGSVDELEALTKAVRRYISYKNWLRKCIVRNIHNNLIIYRHALISY